MTESTERFDRDVANWLDEGVGRAPMSLIESIVDQTRRTNQRPAILAVSLGAPTLGDEHRLGGLTIQSVVLLGLVALMALAAALLAGAPHDWFTQLVVAPSPSTPLRSDPTVSPREATQRPSPTPQVLSTDVYTLTVFSAPDMWTGVSGPEPGHDGQQVVTLVFGSCAPSQLPCFGPAAVTVSTGPTGAPFGVGSDAGGAPLAVVGSTVDELAASWVDRVGVSNVERRDVSGWPALIVIDVTPKTGTFDTKDSAAFVITDRETIAVVSSGPGESRSRLVGILDGLTIRHTPKDVYVDERAGLTIRALHQPWSEALPGMLGTGPAPDQDPSVVAFWYGQCLDNVCPGGHVTVASGTFQAGAVVEVRGSAEAETVLRVAGQTLDDMKTSWIAAFGPSTFENVTIDGVKGAVVRWSDRVAALFVTSRGVVTIVASPAPFGSTNTRSLLDGFLAGVEFLPPRAG